jgi:hypothetical protein
MKPDDTLKEYTCRDPLTYNQVMHSLQKTFSIHRNELNKIKSIAQKIQEGIKRIDPFIQQATRSVCPSCNDVCCISKHGYYTCEDLVYLTALNLEPHQVIFGRNDTDPCQYLLEHGCSVERWLRPSGCTWYFCESLLDYMEPLPAYREFDDSLQDVAGLWIEMITEFTKISSIQNQ